MEELRDQRGWPWLEDLLRDGQFAWRMMRRSPLFTGVAIASLGITSNAYAATETVDARAEIIAATASSTVP